MTDRRPITIDAHDRIVAEGHAPISRGNPEMWQHITLGWSHEDFRAEVGTVIIP